MLCIVGYFVVTKVFDKKNPLAAIPENDIIVETNSKDNIILSWRHNELAKEGYYLIIYKSGVSEPIKSTTVEMMVEDGIQSIVLSDVYYEKGVVYIFEIYCQATENFDRSESTQYEYICN